MNETRNQKSETRKVLGVFLVSGFLSLVCLKPAQAATYYVSPTGSASWSQCATITTPCSLATANTNVSAGDTVYLRGGTYTITGYNGGIEPTNSGIAGSPPTMITFQAYPGESPIITGSQGYGFFLENVSYISIKGITFSNLVSVGEILNASHNEVGPNNTFQSTTGGPLGMYIGPPWDSPTLFSTNNWIHDNYFITSGQANGNGGTGCTDGGGDTLDIGHAYSSEFASVDNDNNNTVENNIFEHAPHASIDQFGMYNVYRNNLMHNEPWSPGCTATSLWPPTYSSSNPDYTAYNGMYAHRNFQVSEDYQRPATYLLVEGNRSGYAGMNQGNGGADNFDLAAPQNIVRYNFLYASMNYGLTFKYGWGSAAGSGGNGGTYNRVYNNTIYDSGYGYPLGLTYISGNASSPIGETNVDLVDGSNSLGNVLKNNLLYSGAGYATWGIDVLSEYIYGSGPYTATNGWSLFAAAVNNWCSGAQTGSAPSGACTGYGDPKFTNPDLSNPASTTLPDLSLQGTSGAIDQGTYLTTATNSGSGSTTLTVADAMYFQDGSWGSDLARASTGLGGTMQADWIAIGTVTNVVQISAVTYGAYNNPAGTITLASPLTWSDGAPVWLYKKSDGAQVLYGAAPDIGAYEFTGPANGPLIDVYISQGGTGGGKSCSDTKDVSFFNTSANWGTGAGQIGPGTTVHLCGTISSTISAQGSGTNSSPITIAFDCSTGGQISMPAIPATGVLTVSGLSYITVDGQGCGIIQSTNNGQSGYANSVGSIAIAATGASHIEVKNLTCGPLYLHNTTATTSFGAPYPVCVDFVGSSDMTIDHSTFTDCAWCAWGEGNAISFHDNSCTNFDHCLGMGIQNAALVQGPVYFYNNSLTHATTWDTGSAGQYHHDGLHLWAYCADGGSYCAGTYWNDVYVYNNHFYGNWGPINTTAFVFFEENIHNAWVFNNWADCTYSGVQCNDGVFYLQGTNIAAYNNTMAASSSQPGSLLFMGGPNVVDENNVMSISPSFVDITAADESGNNLTTISALSHNVYMDTLSNNTWVFEGNFISSLAAWETASGETNASYSASSTVNLPAGTLQAGSPAIRTGANLYSTCNGQPNPGLGALCFDFAGNVRSSTAPWDIGAYQYCPPGACTQTPPPPPPPPPGGTGTTVSGLSAVQVYPNPWRSGKHKWKPVTFANLSANTSVKIFTVSGHLAKDLGTANGTVTWDLTNDSGDKVASGIYIYLITDSQGDKVRGKVAVIK